MDEDEINGQQGEAAFSNLNAGPEQPGGDPGAAVESPYGNPQQEQPTSGGPDGLPQKKQSNSSKQ